MQIRANHIYILFISLLNILSYKIEIKTTSKSSAFLDILFRILLMVSGVIAVIAFAMEHTGNLAERSFTLLAVILSLVAVGLILTNELIAIFVKNKNE